MGNTNRRSGSLRFLIRNKALNFRHFRYYLLTRFSLITALNMQTAIIVYWVYNLTHDVTVVGLLGLAEAIPAIGLSMISGHIVDQREKRNLILASTFGYILIAAGYLALSFPGHVHHFQVKAMVRFIYLGVFLGGCIRAFLSPSSFSLLGLLIPRKLYQNGSTWSSMSWQLGAVIGPLVGGLLIAVSGIWAGLTAALVLVILALFSISKVPRQPILKKDKEPVLKSLREGLRFVFREQLILAALSLDMFAVLFGGATALLPAYAKDILHVNESGYGVLRAAPGMGSLLMFFVLAWMPLKKKPGIKLMLCICGFGVCTIVFGLSKIFLLSFAALLIAGSFDAVSVVIRGTLLQLYTPDAMRGRVSAVSTMFISSSNEIGEVESGLTARWMGGPIPSVVFGGCMTIVVVGVTWLVAPMLRTFKLEPQPEQTVTKETEG